MNSDKNQVPSGGNSLPPIPLIDARDADEAAVATAMAEPERLAMLINSAHRTYSKFGVKLADARSRSWQGRSSSPYGEAVRLVDRAIGQPAAFLLNYSYEWGCTAGAMDHPDGPKMLRTLDWPFDGLGRALIVVRQRGAAGDYLNVAWPGFAGVLTGVASGRFAAAINQPPLPLPIWGKAVGWMAARLKVNGSTALPPSHLLRLAFDTCHGFAEAVSLIRHTPLCLPAIFTLAGTKSGEAIVIERTEHQAFEPGQSAAANHWASTSGPIGRPRNRSSLDRRAAMAVLVAQPAPASLDWLTPPILQADTRVAVFADAASGRLLVQGWEKTGPATALLDLSLAL